MYASNDKNKRDQYFPANVNISNMQINSLY